MYQLLAQTYGQQGNKKEAARVYAHALERRPQDVFLLRDFGTLLAEMGQLDQAIQFLQQAIGLNPSLSDAWYMLGQIYHHQNKSDLAADAYRQVLRIQADHSGAQQRLNQLIK